MEGLISFAGELRTGLDRWVPDSLADFTIEQWVACDKGWVPNEAVVSCIVTHSDPEEIFACDEDLNADLVGLWANAAPAGVAVR